ncbi:MAG TPA: hypothetical protein PKK26_07290, partial [Candidatus Wallbacteria bacterium]|nr:hypothetical protein [Candidatus Wallbacteria bacterium]
MDWPPQNPIFVYNAGGYPNVSGMANLTSKKIASKEFDLSSSTVASVECNINYSSNDANDNAKFAVEYYNGATWVTDVSQTYSNTTLIWAFKSFVVNNALGKSRVRIAAYINSDGSGTTPSFGIDNVKLFTSLKYVYKRGAANTTFYRRDLIFSPDSKNKKITLKVQGTANYTVTINGSSYSITNDAIKTFASPYDFTVADYNVITISLSGTPFSSYVEPAIAYQATVDEKLEMVINTKPPTISEIVAYAADGSNIDLKSNPSPYQYSKDFIVKVKSTSITGLKKYYYKVWSYTTPAVGGQNAPANGTDGTECLITGTDASISIPVTVNYERETCSVWFVDDTDLNGFAYAKGVLMRVDQEKPDKVELKKFKNDSGTEYPIDSTDPDFYPLSVKKPRFRWKVPNDPAFSNMHTTPASTSDGSGCGSYQLQITRSNDFTKPDFEVSIEHDKDVFTTEAYFDPMENMAIGDYKWRVRARDSVTDTDEMNFSDWSDTGELKLDYHPADSYVILPPPEGPYLRETDNTEILPNIYFSLIQTDNVNKYHKIYTKPSTEDTAVIELTNLGADDNYPRVDKDGRYVVFARKDSIKSLIYTIGNDGETKAVCISRQTFNMKNLSAGDRIKYSGTVTDNDATTTEAHVYWVISTKDIELKAKNMAIEYDYYSDTTGAGIGGINVAYESTEISSKNELRDDPAWAATDKPTADFLNGSTRTWLHKKILIPDSVFSYHIKTWEVALENNEVGKNINVYYDNIYVTNTDGSINYKIYSRGKLDYSAISSYNNNYEDYSVSIKKDKLSNEEINTNVANDSSPDISSNGCKVIYSSFDSKYRRDRINISEVSKDYTVKLEITESEAKTIYDKSMDNGDDFRIIWKYWDAAATPACTKEVELDRYLENFKEDKITVWFKIQESAGWSGGPSNYYIEYGRRTVNIPPTDYSKVYYFYDSFDDGIASDRWTQIGNVQWQSDGTVMLPDASSSSGNGIGIYSKKNFESGIGILTYMKTDFVTSEIRIGLAKSDFSEACVFRSDFYDQYLHPSDGTNVWSMGGSWITHPTLLDSIETDVTNYPTVESFSKETGQYNIFSLSWLTRVDDGDAQNTIRWHYNSTDFPNAMNKAPRKVKDSGALPLYMFNIDSTSPVYIDKVIVRLLREKEPTASIDTTTIEIKGRYEVALVNINDGSYDGGERYITTNSEYDRIRPRISPDGSKITYMADVGGNQYDVYLINSDGTGNTRLTSYFGNDKDPSFSPDGQKIIYLQETYDVGLSGTVSVIFTMNSDGTNQQELKPPCPASKRNFRSPVYGSLGDRIFYSRVADAGNYEVYCLWARDGHKGISLESSIDSLETKISELDSNQDADYISVENHKKVGWYSKAPIVRVVSRDWEGHGSRIYYNWTNDSVENHTSSPAKSTLFNTLTYDVPLYVPSDGHYTEKLTYFSTDTNVKYSETYFIGKQDSGNVELQHKTTFLIDIKPPAPESRIHVRDFDGVTGTTADSQEVYNVAFSKNGFGGDSIIRTAEVNLVIPIAKEYVDWVYLSNYETAPVGFEPEGMQPVGYETEPVSFDFDKGTTNAWLRSDTSSAYFFNTPAPPTTKKKWILDKPDDSGVKKIYAWFGSEGRVIKMVSEEIYLVTDIPKHYTDEVYVTNNSDFNLGKYSSEISIKNDSAVIEDAKVGTCETPVLRLGSHVTD